MKKMIVIHALLGALVLAALYGSSAFAHCELATKDGSDGCKRSRSSSSTPSIDPTTAAIIQLGTMIEQDRARKRELEYERELEREERRAAMEAQWERESAARQAAWQQQNQSYQNQLAAKRREYDAAVDRMRAKVATRTQNPIFLDKNRNQSILLGVGGIGAHAGGFNTLTDQNGKQVGSYRLHSRLSADGQFAEVEIEVSNQSNCKMYFNGYFKKDDTPYKVLDFGTGPEVASGGSTKLKGRVPAGGKNNLAAMYSFKPTADFVQCGGAG